MSLANTQEVMRLVNRSANRPSHKGTDLEGDEYTLIRWDQPTQVVQAALRYVSRVPPGSLMIGQLRRVA